MQEIGLDEQKKALLDLLEVFDEFCKKHNIIYSLGGGTLIGAVRHKGFIPWDDDIDIYMYSDEYERFAKCYQDNSRYALANLYDKNHYFFGFMEKFYDKNYLLEDLKHNKSPLFLDIFIYDFVPDDVKYINKTARRYKFLRTFTRSLMKRSQKFAFLNHIASFFSKKTLNLLKNWRKNFTDETCENIALFMSDCSYGEKAIMNKNLFKDVVLLEFEGKKFPCMNGYDEHLRKFYGDYLILPPKEEQISRHTHKCYKISK